jgi:hypothetical protein
MSLVSLYDEASLWMTPSGAKDGKLFSELPTDGSGDFTFSRGSNLAATRVDVNGLIEKGRENLLTESNNFSDSDWAKVNTSVTGGQTGYDGSSDAWLLSKSAANGYVRQVNLNFNGVQTFSVYAKAGSSDWTTLLIQGAAAYNVWFDLQNGIVGDTTLPSVNFIGGSINSVGNGWYRCSITINGTSVTNARVYPADGDRNTSATSGSIYIQDAQLELGLVATDYIETGASTAQAGILEDMPRLDYSGGASCPSLLLEPQRSNLVTQSEYFNSYSKVTSDATAVPVVTDNYAISPEGLQNAARVVVTKPSTDNDYAFIREAKSIAKTSGDKMSQSVYLKATDASQIGKIVDVYAYDGSYLSVTNHTLTSEWERVEAIHTASVGTSNTEMVIGKARAYAGGTTLANMATDFLVYGHQFENGSSYPTSYIPTYGTSQTRSLDTFEVTGISDLIDSQGGVMLLESQALDRNQGYSGISLSDDTFTNNAQIRYGSATDQVQIQYRVGSSNECLASNSENDITNNLKIAFKYEANSFKMFVNGVLEATDTSGSVNAANTFDTIKSDRGDGNDKYIGKIKQLVVFPTALTDSECVELTINGLKEELIAAYKTRVTTLEEGASERLDTYLQSLEDFIII